MVDQGLTAFVEKNSSETSPANSWDLEKLTLAAFYYSPDIELARAQWAVARGGETTAAQQPNPTLTFTPGFDSTPSSLSPWFPLWMLDIPIETAGKRKYRRAHSERLSEAARLQVARVAWQVRSNVRTGLLQLSAATKHEQGVQKTLELYNEILEALKDQVKLGAISKSDVTVYDIAMQKARLDVADAARQKSEARAKLAESVGIPLRALDGVRLEMPAGSTHEQLTSSEARRAALLGRADVLGGLAEYAAAESALRLEIAKQYPDVHLQPGYQFDQGDNKWSLGLVVELPVLSHNQGPILEAKARRQEAAARFTALQAKVMAEIDKAEEELKVGRANFAAFGDLSQAQQKQLASAEAQYRAGEVEKLDWYKARLDAAATELAVIDAEAKVQQAIGALEDAIQRPLNYMDTVYAGPKSEEKSKSRAEK